MQHSCARFLEKSLNNNEIEFCTEVENELNSNPVTVSINFVFIFRKGRIFFVPNFPIFFLIKYDATQAWCLLQEQLRFHSLFDQQRIGEFHRYFQSSD